MKDEFIYSSFRTAYVFHHISIDKKLKTCFFSIMRQTVFNSFNCCRRSCESISNSFTTHTPVLIKRFTNDTVTLFSIHKQSFFPIPFSPVQVLSIHAFRIVAIVLSIGDWTIDICIVCRLSVSLSLFLPLSVFVDEV